MASRSRTSLNVPEIAPDPSVIPVNEPSASLVQDRTSLRVPGSGRNSGDSVRQSSSRGTTRTGSGASAAGTLGRTFSGVNERGSIAHRISRASQVAISMLSPELNRTGLDRLVWLPTDPPRPGQADLIYPTNMIRTTKYTFWNFLPKNLFLQFKRVANTYFLIMFILQTIPVLNAWPVVTAWVPITFVLAATAVKDAIEDFKRSQSDRKINSQVCETLVQGQFQKEEWQNIVVGDIVHLCEGDDVPADMIVLATSEPQAVCYVETKNLDGETNLKERRGLKRTENLTDAASLSKLAMQIHAEAPTKDLYTFSAKVTVGEMNKSESVTVDSLLLRGCKLRNCADVYALVLYTGVDTKIVLNSGATPLKRTKLEKLMNGQILVILAIQFAFCIAFAIANGFWLRETSEENAVYSLSSFSYQNNALNAFLNFFTLMIISQNLIPIAMYASVEIVKLVQAYFIYLDVEMLEQKSGEYCIPNTWTLSDDLGQVEYVFSDKTGTLTSNIMKFRQCTVGGVVYGHMQSLAEKDEQADRVAEAARSEARSDLEREQLSSNSLASTTTLEQARARASATKGPKRPAAAGPPTSVPAPALGANGAGGLGATMVKVTGTPALERRNSVTEGEGNWKATLATLRSRLGDDAMKFASTSFDFEDDAMIDALVGAQKLAAVGDPAALKAATPEQIAQARTMNDFFIAIAVCHGVMTERCEPELVDTAEGLRYSAQSPDEAALVEAARNFGYVFLGRTRDELNCMLQASRCTFKVVYTIPFTSERKRMSVIAKMPDGQYRLFCKGADNVILARIGDGQAELKLKTEEHLLDFSRNGLRTLCYAQRSLDADEVVRWVQAAEEAHMLVPLHRDLQLAQLYGDMETGLTLLGGTAIEDKLQTGVPETVASLGHAGIRVWMLTGDKLETAINIGLSCRLFDDEDTSLIIQGTNLEAVSLALMTAYYRLFPERLNTDTGTGPRLKRSHSRNTERGRRSSLMRVIATGGLSGPAATTREEPESLSPVDGARAVLVIDGTALGFALNKHREVLLDVACACRSVICCRVSPSQKAEVVDLVRLGRNGFTLAIGDGANDVNMIQRAHVGIGISGLEGRQAAMSADYSFARFRFLQRLLFVHGRWSYYRTSEMILTFFFKNFIFVFPLFWYQFLCGFSAQMIYQYSYQILYNLLFTSLPVIIVAVFDQDLGQDFCMNNPQAYSVGPRGERFNRKLFWFNILDGIYQGTVCFLFAISVFGWNEGAISQTGRQGGLYGIGVVVCAGVVLCAHASLAIQVRNWTWLMGFFFVLSLLTFFAYTIIAGSVIGAKSFLTYDLSGSLESQFGVPITWFTIAAMVVVATLPRLITRYVLAQYKPLDTDLMREREKLERRRR